MNVHFNRATGEIVMWDTSNRAPANVESHFPGNVVALIKADGNAAIDAKRQRVDPASVKQAGGHLVAKLIDKSAAETAAALQPGDHEVRAAIALELWHTDGFVVPDRELPEAARAAWIAYRQGLRRLSKLATPAAMIEAWPQRPDSHDVVQHLRNRTKQKEIPHGTPILRR